LSLSNRVFHGGVWVSAAFAFARLLGLLRLTVLTHLLLPTDFGLITIITLVVSSMWVLSDTGTAASVIQKNNPSVVFLHTAWHMNWMRGFILACICWLLAPWLAIFFEHPELETLLQWAALIPFIQGFESLGMVLLKKELNFKQRAYVDFTRESIQTAVAIALVVYWQASALSVLWGIVAGVLAASILSYFLHAYRPSLSFSKTSMIEIWKYGRHLLGAGILIFAMTNLDDVIVGKVLGIEQLGYYGVAFTLAAILTNQLVQVFNTVMFPALSQIQDDYSRIQQVLELSSRLMAGVLTPVVCFVALFPSALVEVFLSTKWLPIVDVLLVLLAMGWVRGIATIFGPILMACGKTAVMHKMKWLEFALFSVLIMPAVYTLGVVGAALVLLAVYCLSLFLHMRAVNAVLQQGYREIYTSIFKGSLPGVLAFAVVMLVNTIYPEVRLLFSSMLYICTWLLLLWLWEKVFVMQLVNMVKSK